MQGLRSAPAVLSIPYGGPSKWFSEELWDSPMSIALHHDPSRPAFARSIAKLARTMLAVLAFMLVVATVAFVRTFAFEYFHGDPAPLHGLAQVILEN